MACNLFADGQKRRRLDQLFIGDSLTRSNYVLRDSSTKNIAFLLTIEKANNSIS